MKVVNTRRHHTRERATSQPFEKTVMNESHIHTSTRANSDDTDETVEILLDDVLELEAVPIEWVELDQELDFPFEYVLEPIEPSDAIDVVDGDRTMVSFYAEPTPARADGDEVKPRATRTHQPHWVLPTEKTDRQVTCELVVSVDGAVSRRVAIPDEFVSTLVRMFSALPVDE